MNLDQLFVYTFRGLQNRIHGHGHDPFSIQVVSHDETDARKRALKACCVAASKAVNQAYLERNKLHILTSRMNDLLSQISPTMPLNPIDSHIENWCAKIDEFFNPIFFNPMLKSQKWNPDTDQWSYNSDETEDDEPILIPFDQWIRVVPFKKEKFNPYTIHIYSCLYG